MIAPDPRVAALAMALHVVECGNISTPSHGLHMNEAAAVLAALPPDWCGDAAGIEAIIEATNTEHDRLEATIARLRKIGQAARAVVNQAEPDDNWEGQFDTYLVPSVDLDILRAALGEEGRSPDPLQALLDGMPKDGLPDTLGDHFRVVTVCGHCGEVWSSLFGEEGR